MSTPTNDSKQEEFTFNNLPLLSPFEPLSMKIEQRTSRKGLQFPMYLVTIVPAQNRAVKAEVAMFKSQYDQIRAIRFLNPKALIQATKNPDGKTVTLSGVTAPF